MRILAKPTLARLALAGAGALAALVVAEAALRMFPGVLPESVRFRIHWVHLAHSSTGSIGDPYLGFVYPPHLSRKVESTDVAFWYSTDERGFRNPSSWPDRADVVVVGDSMVFGFGVANDSVWTHLLANRLPNERIINLGLPGTAPQQFTRAYERFGIPLNPDLLLFGLPERPRRCDGVRAMVGCRVAGELRPVAVLSRKGTPRSRRARSAQLLARLGARDDEGVSNPVLRKDRKSLRRMEQLLLTPRTLFRVAEDASPVTAIDLVLGATSSWRRN